jgi:hypothetical protein
MQQYNLLASEKLKNDRVAEIDKSLAAEERKKNSARLVVSGHI